jgi:O-antigen ligase
MIQKILTKYAVALHIAVIGAFALFCLQRQSAAGAPFFWLTLIAVEMACLLPSVHHEETLMDARLRVLSSIVWDPMFYLLLVLVLFFAAQGMNGGCELKYEPGADVWRMGAPKIPWLPFAVKAEMGYRWTAIVFAALSIGLVFRDVLSKGSKRLALQILAGVSGAVGLVLAAMTLYGSPIPGAKLAASFYQFSGTCFGFWAVAALGIHADMTLHETRGHSLLLFFGVVGNLVGLLFFAEALQAGLFLLAALGMAVFSVSKLSGRMKKRDFLKGTISLLIIVAAIVFLLVYVFPGNPCTKKILSVMNIDDYLKQFFANRGLRASAAMAIFQEHPWVGVGAGGFGEFVGLFVPQDGGSWALIQKDQACVLNDYLQMLCEYGVVGATLVLAALLTLLIPICFRLRVFVQGIRWGNHRQAAGENEQEVSPIVLPGLVALGLLAVAAGMGNPFIEPAVLLSGISLMACLPNFLPAHVSPAVVSVPSARASVEIGDAMKAGGVQPQGDSEGKKA